MELGTIYDTLRIFGHHWTLEILESLSLSPKRFNDLQRAIGNINSKTHRDALARLVKHGLVRHPDDGDGQHYALTPRGQLAMPALLAFVKALSDWEDARDSGDRSRR